MKDLTEYTIEDFNALPEIERDIQTFNYVDCRSLVVIPTGTTHDSGFGCMKFALFNSHGEPMGVLGGGSDVIHIEGIGGYGYNWSKTGKVPESVPVGDWNIDCLPCGLLRLFARGMIRCGYPLSSFEVWTLPRPGVEK